MFMSREIDKKKCVKVIPTLIYMRFGIKPDYIKQIRNQSENYDIPEEPK